MITYQDTITIVRDNRIAPRRCNQCRQVRTTGLAWAMGCDDGTDPAYVGYRCENCGNVQGLTRTTIVRRRRQMRAW